MPVGQSLGGAYDSPWLNAHFLWAMVRKRQILILVTVLVVEAFGALMTLRSPKLYPASAKVIIQDDISRLLQGPDPLGSYIYSEEFFQTQYRRLNSLPVIERAVKAERMTEWEEFRGISDLPGVLGGQIQLSPIRESRMVVMTYEGPDPRHAVMVINAVLEAFKKEFQATRREQATKNVVSLGSTLPEITETMRDLEQRQIDHMKKYNLITADPEFIPSYIKLKELSQREADLQADLYEQEAYVSVIDKAGADGVALMEQEGVGSEQRLFAYDGVLAQLETLRIERSKVFGPDSIEVRTVEDQIKIIESRRVEVAKQLVNGVKNRFERTKAALQKLQAEKKILEDDVQIVNGRLFELERIKSQLKEAQDRFQEVLVGQGRIPIYADLGVSPILIAEGPVEAASPSKPLVTRNLALAFLLGLFLGIGLAAILEFFDDSVRNTQDLQAFAGIPCLAMIPQMRDILDKGERMAAVYAYPRSEAAEAFRTLRATLDLLIPAREGKARVLMICSAQQDEGKTTVASNVAVAQAMNGHRVLMLNCDLRKPVDLTVFKMGAEHPALPDYLAGHSGLNDLVSPTAIENLSMVKPRYVEENPSELLGHARMTELLTWARERFDVVVIDTPPVLSVADALVISPLADHALLVAHGGKTGRAAVTEARQIFGQSRVRLIGAVLNDLSGNMRRERGYYEYRYNYYSGGSEPKKREIEKPSAPPQAPQSS